MASLEERVYSLGEETKAKDLVIDTLKEHIRKHPEPEPTADQETGGRARSSSSPVTTTEAAIATTRAEVEGEELAGGHASSGDEEVDSSDEEEAPDADVPASAAAAAAAAGTEESAAADLDDPMTQALLEAAFDCDIDVATRLYKSGAKLPELFPLIHDMHTRALPTETEATAIYVIEGLRAESDVGKGATAALMRVCREKWFDLPDLSATLKSVCMVADAEFSETTEAMPPFLHELAKVCGRVGNV